MDNIGLHLPSKPLKEMDAFKAYVDESINWVTFEEAMLSGTALECRTTRSAHYAAVFAELDTDKSGSISLEEFTSHASDADSLFNKYFKDLASNISESFAKMDKDKNNSLSWEEFVGCAEEAFAATLHPKAAQELEAAVEVAVTPFDEALKNKAEPTTASEASNDDDAEEEQKQVEEARAEMEKIKEEKRKKDAAEYLERKKKEKRKPRRGRQLRLRRRRCRPRHRSREAAASSPKTNAKTKSNVVLLSQARKSRLT